LLMSVCLSVCPAVCRYTKWFPIIIYRTICHRAFIFHMLMGLGEDKNPNPNPRSVVKVTRVTFVKKYNCFLLIILRTFYNTAFIFHMLFGLSRTLFRHLTRPNHSNSHFQSFRGVLFFVPLQPIWDDVSKKNQQNT